MTRHDCRPDSRDSVELLPCPFCGSEAERIDFGPGSGDNEGGSCIACTKCQASGPVEFGYKENFVANWNRRALARGPQQAGGEDYARLWRNRWVSDRTAYWQPTAGNYESARIRAEAEAADYEQTFDAARERLRDAALNGGQDDA